MFDKFHITFASAVTAAALGILALLFAPSAISASICADVITTTWTVVDDANTTSDTSFTACSTTSTVSGDGFLFGGHRDPYSWTVEAIDGDTFQVLGSVTDLAPPDATDFLGGFSPEITLVLDMPGMSGTITNAFKTSVGPCNPPCEIVVLNVIDFTTNSVTLGGNFSMGAFGGGSLGCFGEGCSLTNINMGTFDITVVPLPAALPFFLSALGILGWMRRKRN